MEFITIKQAAEKWDLTPRRVQMLCKKGKINGAQKWGNTWQIPSEATLPKEAERADSAQMQMPMPKKSPFFRFISPKRP